MSAIYMVTAGATSTGLTVGSGSSLYVFAGGTADATTITGANFFGGIATDYGVMSGTAVNNYGELSVSSGGSASSTTVDKYGELYVNSSASVVSTTLNANGSVAVYSGGTAYATVVNSAGVLIVESGGASYGAVINSSGGAGIVGLDSGTKIMSGGVDVIFSEGVGSGIVVEKGGILSGGGSLYYTVVSKGGIESLAGGNDFDATLMGGSQSVVEAKTTGTIISKGGEQDLTVSGLSSGTKIEAGGTETVGYGSVASGSKIYGGTLDIEGGTASSSITFSGKGGKLIIGDGSAAPTTTISGFVAGDEIEIPLLAAIKKVTVAVMKAGVVTVSGGGQSYALKIAGAKVGSTGYKFSKGILTTTVVSAKMEFLKPDLADAVTMVPNGGKEFAAAPVIAAKNAEVAAITSSQAAYAVGGLVDSENLAHSAALVGLRGDAQKVF